MSRRLGHSPTLLLALLLVGLVAASGVAVTQSTTQSSLVTVENSTNYLTIPGEDIRQESHGTIGVDVGTAVSTDAQRLHGEHERRTFTLQYEQADSPEEQEDVATQAVLSAERRLETLDDEHVALLRAHSNGTLSSEQYLAELVRIETTADQQQAYLETVGETVDDSSDVSLPVRLDQYITNARAQLILLPAPVDGRVATAMNGTGDSRQVYVQTGDDGAILATVDDEQFTRQATLRSEYVPDGPDQFDGQDEPRIVVAFQRGAELYPWLFDSADGTPSISGFGDTAVYLVAAEHPHGTTESYIDGATTNVFREHQTGDPASVPVTAVATNDTAELDATVELTRPTGPMRVTVTDGDGAPVRANVSVNGQTVGFTDENGQLWTVQPSGEYSVTATTTTGDAVVVRSVDAEPVGN